MSWPEKLTVGTETWNRETCSDGYVYRVTGVSQPHVTIHNVTSPTKVDFYEWRRTSAVYHLRYYATGKLWEYERGEPYAFTTQSGKKTTNTGGEEPQANELAKAFWKACDEHDR
jgi:hypothetical protein